MKFLLDVQLPKKLSLFLIHKDKNITVPFLFTKEKDLYYKIRKERLHSLHEDIRLGKETMYDFESSVDELIEELKF